MTDKELKETLRYTIANAMKNAQHDYLEWLDKEMKKSNDFMVKKTVEMVNETYVHLIDKHTIKILELELSVAVMSKSITALEQDTGEAR